MRWITATSRQRHLERTQIGQISKMWVISVWWSHTYLRWLRRSYLQEQTSAPLHYCLIGRKSCSEPVWNCTMQDRKFVLGEEKTNATSEKCFNRISAPHANKQTRLQVVPIGGDRQLDTSGRQLPIVTVKVKANLAMGTTRPMAPHLRLWILYVKTVFKMCWVSVEGRNTRIGHRGRSKAAAAKDDDKWGAHVVAVYVDQRSFRQAQCVAICKDTPSHINIYFPTIYI